MIRGKIEDIKISQEINSLKEKEANNAKEISNIKIFSNQNLEIKTNNIQNNLTKEISDLKFQIYYDLSKLKEDLKEETNQLKIEQASINYSSESLKIENHHTLNSMSK